MKDKLTLEKAGGNICLRIVIGQQQTQIEVLDTGYHGTPDEPKVMTRFGYFKDTPYSYMGTVPQSEWIEAVSGGTCVDPEDDDLCEALEELMLPLTNVMTKLGWV